MTPTEIKTAFTDIRTGLDLSDLMTPLLTLLADLASEVERLSGQVAELSDRLTDDGK